MPDHHVMNRRPYYTGQTKNWRKADDPVKLPRPVAEVMVDPEDYWVHPDLAAAVEVALMLGQPLLLTGEPGTGKTQLAYNVARELALGVPEKFEVKSTTEARDLFYTFDAVQHFRDSRQEGQIDVQKYIAFQALGSVILRTLPPDHPNVKRYWNSSRNGEFDGPRRSVALIDEVDKAPRDVPNDLLNEIEYQHFHIYEDDNRRVESDGALRPVVIITSNSEKHLPEPFLRRCVYHHIQFPPATKLNEIVRARLSRLDEEGHNLPDSVINEVLHLFYLLRREHQGLRRAPGTSEILAGFMALRRRVGAVAGTLKTLHSDAEISQPVLELLGVLIKDKDDRQTALKTVKEWHGLSTPDLADIKS